MKHLGSLILDDENVLEDGLKVWWSVFAGKTATLRHLVTNPRL